MIVVTLMLSAPDTDLAAYDERELGGSSQRSAAMIHWGCS
ncbi:MAG: hypothetical protein ACJAR2_000137 [Ilumatobacter sp.]|jgi:hypothetical protein